MIGSIHKVFIAATLLVVSSSTYSFGLGLLHCPRGGAGEVNPSSWFQGKIRMFAEALSENTNNHEAAASCLAADDLMKKRGAENYKKAYDQYKAALGTDPSNDSLKFKVAEAAVSYLRSITNANAVTLTGTMDSPENRQSWKAYAPEAYNLLHVLHKAKPNDASIHVLMTEAFTYSTSSKGILKAAVTGDGLVFMRYVNQIVSKYPSYDSGVSHIFRGAFLIAAPWPLRDIKGAVKSFNEALKVEPKSLRNNYFYGIASHYNGDYDVAAKHFEIALTEAESIAASEKDVASFFKSESKKSLDATRKKIAESSK